MVTIKKVINNSLSGLAGMKKGDILISINGFPVYDVLDYQFRIADKRLSIEYEQNGKRLTALMEKDEYEDIGLEFETYLMDSKRRCANSCIFCFVDQNPCGMRESIYFKDDDERLSFLQGNYITLTNLTKREIDRIKEMHISPINVSVHTTDPELRIAMLRNKNAGRVYALMKELAEAHISMNAQIVLCRGWNDGEHLQRTLSDLCELFPFVQSVAVVPAGLTRYREGLTPLKAFDEAECKKVIELIEGYSSGHYIQTGHRFIFASDEFYLGAGLELPADEEYDGYLQLDNGVGMLRLLREEFTQALESVPLSCLKKKRELSIATGKAAYKTIQELCVLACNKYKKLNVSVFEIENEFYGSSITVSGLLTGSDLAAQLKGVPLGEELLISRSMLRADGDLFLDGYTPERLEKELGVPVTAVESSGDALLDALLGL